MKLQIKKKNALKIQYVNTLLNNSFNMRYTSKEERNELYFYVDY